MIAFEYSSSLATTSFHDSTTSLPMSLLPFSPIPFPHLPFSTVQYSYFPIITKELLKLTNTEANSKFSILTKLDFFVAFAMVDHSFLKY